MLIAAGLIELHLAQSESIKAKRSVANSVKTRVRQRFNVSVAEVADHDDRHSVCLGCVMVGVDPRHLRSKMNKIVEYVESLGLADSVTDDVEVLRLDEISPVAEDEIGEDR